MFSYYNTLGKRGMCFYARRVRSPIDVTVTIKKNIYVYEQEEKMFQRIDRPGFYYGFPVLLMTTKDQETGEDALTPLSSSWVLDQTIVIGIGAGNKGFCNIEAGADMVFNLPGANLYENVKRIERLTGLRKLSEVKKNLGYTYCADKFGVGGFTKLPGETVAAVRIPECPFHIEATVESITRKDWFAIVVCHITAIFADEKLLTADGRIDTVRWQPLIYKLKEYTTTGVRLELNFGFREY